MTGKIKTSGTSGEFHYEIDFTKVSDMVDGSMSKKLRKEVSVGIRDSLAILQRHHKTKSIQRGGGKRKPVANKWTWRTGEAGRSFHIAMKRNALIGAYGSSLRRVRVLELGSQAALGGPIRPVRAQFLAIPTENAKSGVGGAVSPRDRNDLFFVRSNSGEGVLLQKGTLALMFILRRSVTIPPRLTLLNAQIATKQKVRNRMMLAARRGTDGK
jgi:hypothetical protein